MIILVQREAMVSAGKVHKQNRTEKRTRLTRHFPLKHLQIPPVRLDFFGIWTAGNVGSTSSASSSSSLSLSKTWTAEEFTGKYLNVKEKTKSTKARLGKATSNHFFGLNLEIWLKDFILFWRFSSPHISTVNFEIQWDFSIGSEHGVKHVKESQTF